MGRFLPYCSALISFFFFFFLLFLIKIIIVIIVIIVIICPPPSLHPVSTPFVFERAWHRHGICHGGPGPFGALGGGVAFV